ncbi:MAG: hypothetical protein HQL95_07115, partial [Magnetococcales bacterium]|nr:hypothetical protein [Magnetococcales bacterium]
MAEHPILFSVPMVQAILAGRKTQTRRVIKSQPVSVDAVKKIAGCDYGWSHCRIDPPNTFSPNGPVWAVKRAMGMDDNGPMPRIVATRSIGERMWVRETFRAFIPNGNPEWHVRYAADNALVVKSDCQWDEGPQYLTPECVGLHVESNRWRPSIHMPRWASRITLEITGVRVEQLQSITEEDAMMVGIIRFHTPMDHRFDDHTWFWDGYSERVK